MQGLLCVLFFFIYFFADQILLTSQFIAHAVPVSLYVLFSVLRNDSEPTVHQRLTAKTETCELNQKQVSLDGWIILCTEDADPDRGFLKCKYVEICGLYADWILCVKGISLTFLEK